MFLKNSFRTKSYIILFTLVVGISFFINIWASVMKRNLLAYSYKIFYYNTRIQSKQRPFSTKVFGKVLNKKLPLFLSVMSHQFFFFIGSQNLFHLLT